MYDAPVATKTDITRPSSSVAAMELKTHTDRRLAGKKRQKFHLVRREKLQRNATMQYMKTYTRFFFNRPILLVTAGYNGQSPKVNFTELLWLYFALSVAKPTASKTEGKPVRKQDV